MSYIGLPASATNGEIDDFTGVSAPYEAPENPELVIDTGTMTVDESIDVVAEYIQRNISL